MPWWGHSLKAYSPKAYSAMHTFSQSGKNPVFSLAVTFLATFSCAGVHAAAMPSAPSHEAAPAPVKTESRAKVAVKKQKTAPNKASSHLALAPASVLDTATQAQAALASKPSQPVVVDAPQAATDSASEPMARGNPYLVNMPQIEAASTPAKSNGNVFGGNSFKLAMPHIPLFEQAILPRIKTVYPTGEKPLVVVTFKCPTELVGIDTPSTLILHKAINGGMELVNKTNLLSFNMQQVCQ